MEPEGLLPKTVKKYFKSVYNQEKIDDGCFVPGQFESKFSQNIYYVGFWLNSTLYYWRMLYVFSLTIKNVTFLKLWKLSKTLSVNWLPRRKKMIFHKFEYEISC